MVSNAFVTKVHGGKTSHQAHLQAEALFKALLQVVGSYQDLGSYIPYHPWDWHILVGGLSLNPFEKY